MSAIAVSSDGDNIFLALEDGSGNPVYLQTTRADLTTWTEAYAPGAGTSANVKASPANPDVMLFYGNFGTDLVVSTYTISTTTVTDISPASLAAKEVNTLDINPGGVSELVIGVDTDQDLKNSDDGGTTWVDWDAALGFDQTALAVLFSGLFYPHRYFSAGQVGGVGQIKYSPNEGADNIDVTEAMSVTNIVSIEVTEEVV